MRHRHHLRLRISHRLNYVILAMLLLGNAYTVIMPSIAYSLESDREQVIYLRADSANINNVTRKGIYKGHVELNQGTTHLRANVAKTLMDKKNQLVETIALGTKEKQAHYWTLSDPNKPELHAFANTIKFYPKKNKVILIGKARVIQGEDSYTAPQIEYDTITQHVVSTASKYGKTTILIHPKKTA